MLNYNAKLVGNMDVNIILILLAASGLSFSNNCSIPLGTDDEGFFTAVRDHSFYLNTAHPALCSGTVTRWRYCYYSPPIVNGANLTVIYRTSFAVYRRMMDSSSGLYAVYERVSDVFSIIVREENHSHDSSFECDILEVDVSFTIEAGDVVGACIFDPVDSENRLRKQLNIVGETNGYSLQQMSDVSDCTVGLNKLPVTISNSMLTAINSRVLHLYADIESKSHV